MTAKQGHSRRDFVKQVGAAAGALAVSPTTVGAGTQQSPVEVPEDTPRSVFPTLNRRTRGWLRFLWDKTTTDDDWSSTGVPHTSGGPATPSRSCSATGGSTCRSPPTHCCPWQTRRRRGARSRRRLLKGWPVAIRPIWGAIDWLTQIGDDPKRENSPPLVMGGIPERLRGSSNRFGSR